MSVLARVASSSSSRLLTTTPTRIVATQIRSYKSRLTKESFFEGKNLPKYAPIEQEQAAEQYVVEDKKQPPFKVPEGVKILGFKYPEATGADSKTFYALLPRKAPLVEAGIAGELVESIYKAAVATDSVMSLEQELKQVVLPLVQDEELANKFFSNAVMSVNEKVSAIEAWAKEQKPDPIITELLLEVVESGTFEHLPAVVRMYSDLMKRIRCEATAEVVFGRMPTRNEVIKVKQLLADLRSPTQYYVHSSFIVDPALGGGLSIKAGDFELDGSLQTRLEEVKKHMLKSLE